MIDIELNIQQSIDPTINALDVLCGRSKVAFHHAGNHRFRDIIASTIRMYKNATMKREKGQIVNFIMNEILSTGARFMKRDERGWVKLDARQIKDKIGHALRDAERDGKERVIKKTDTTKMTMAVMQKRDGIPLRKNLEDICSGTTMFVDYRNEKKRSLNKTITTTAMKTTQKIKERSGRKRSFENIFSLNRDNSIDSSSSIVKSDIANRIDLIEWDNDDDSKHSKQLDPLFRNDNDNDNNRDQSDGRARKQKRRITLPNDVTCNGSNDTYDDDYQFLTKINSVLGPMISNVDCSLEREPIRMFLESLGRT